jgi:hypothetical protein
MQQPAQQQQGTLPHQHAGAQWDPDVTQLSASGRGLEPQQQHVSQYHQRHAPHQQQQFAHPAPMQGMPRETLHYPEQQQAPTQQDEAWHRGPPQVYSLAAATGTGAARPPPSDVPLSAASSTGCPHAVCTGRRPPLVTEELQYAQGATGGTAPGFAPGVSARPQGPVVATTVAAPHDSPWTAAAFALKHLVASRDVSPYDRTYRDTVTPWVRTVLASGTPWRICIALAISILERSGDLADPDLCINCSKPRKCRRHHLFYRSSDDAGWHRFSSKGGTDPTGSRRPIFGLQILDSIIRSFFLPARSATKRRQPAASTVRAELARVLGQFNNRNFDIGLDGLKPRSASERTQVTVQSDPTEGVSLELICFDDDSAVPTRTLVPAAHGQPPSPRCATSARS